jgi:TrmH family RNA methyltransferase
MITNNEIKQVRQLHQKKYRAEQGRFIVEGAKPVDELLRSGITVENVYYTSDNIASAEIPENVISQSCSPAQMERMSTLRTPPGILAVAVIPQFEQPKELTSWVIALDEVSDPGNLGTILRIADWFGINHVFASENVVEEFNPKVVQSSMGAVFRIPVHRVVLEDWLQKVQLPDCPVIAADMQGESLDSFPFTPRGVLVMGSESHGLSEEIKNQVSQLITIPGKGKAESLNVAVATGIICSRLPVV